MRFYRLPENHPYGEPLGSKVCIFSGTKIILVSLKVILVGPKIILVRRQTYGDATVTSHRCQYDVSSAPCACWAVIRPSSVRSGKYTTLMVTNEKQENSTKLITRTTNKRLIDYRVLTNIGQYRPTLTGRAIL